LARGNRRLEWHQRDRFVPHLPISGKGYLIASRREVADELVNC
jgi:hypothetical protein